MITAAIIDDEPKSVFTLKSFLEEHCTEVQVVGTANNAKTGKDLIESLKPQLLFLDIEMPLGSGFDLLRSLPIVECEIIFITAYNQYAINAFRFSALDYLLKPLRISHLMEAVEKAEKKIAEKIRFRNYEILLHNMKEHTAAKQKMVFTDRGQQFPVYLNEIMYIIADGNYSHIYTENKTFISSKNLKEYEDLLPDELFVRIHHGHIVNIEYITKVQRGRGGVVTMKNGTALEIAVRRKEEFIKRINRA